MKQRIPSSNSYSLIVMFCGFTVYGMTVTGGCVQVPIVFNIRQYDLLQTICRADIPFSRGCESLLLSKGILMKVLTKHRLLIKHFSDIVLSTKTMDQVSDLLSFTQGKNATSQLSSNFSKSTNDNNKRQ